MTGFTPQQCRQRSRDHARDHTCPDWNGDAVYRDLPARNDANQLQQRDQRKDDNSDRAEWLHRGPPYALGL